MRNSILGVLGEMISRVLSGEDLDAKQKSTRDQFLDKLEVVHFVKCFKTLNLVDKLSIACPSLQTTDVPEWSVVVSRDPF